MDLAPIALSAYSRVKHIQQTVDALAANDLADQSDLYVFSDAPRPGDEAIVAEMRNFLDSITGFKNVTIIKRETNNRAFNNRDGIRQLLSKYGKMIFLEEDIVTAPGFLKFINQGLNVYEKREDVFAVCGYTPPIRMPKDYADDIFLCPRFSAWGYGFWKNSFDQIIFDREQYRRLLKDKSRLNQFRKNGEDLVSLLAKEADERIDAMDVKIFFTQFIYQSYVVCPVRSLTLNTGFDGTGIHCGTTKRYDVDLWKQIREFKTPLDIQPDNRINRKLYLFRSKLPEPLLARWYTQMTRPVKKLLSPWVKQIRSAASSLGNQRPSRTSEKPLE